MMMNPDLLFAALADPTRRAILSRLAQGEASVNELVVPFELAQPTITKHIKVLEAAGLVTRGRDKQRRPVRLNAAPLAEAAAWIDQYRQFWEASYDRLNDYVQSLKENDQ